MSVGSLIFLLYLEYDVMFLGGFFGLKKWVGIYFGFSWLGELELLKERVVWG